MVSLLKRQFDVSSAEIIVDPLVPLLEPLALEVVLPAADLALAVVVLGELLQVGRTQLDAHVPHVVDGDVFHQSFNLIKNRFR